MGVCGLAFGLALYAAASGMTVTGPYDGDDFEVLSQRLKLDDPGDYDKVIKLAVDDRRAALEFLRERFGKAGTKTPDESQPSAPPNGPKRRKDKTLAPQPQRRERYSRIDMIRVGEFSLELCRRDDGAFGLGEIRHRERPLRRPDFLVTWQVDGEFPIFDRRTDVTVFLRDPAATLTFTPERRECAETSLLGLRLRFVTERGPIIETASWELDGSTDGLTYFDGYRGWHAPPDWLAADAVPETNPKLMPSLLHGTGFQFLYGRETALIHFHTTTGDRLRNVSRGQTLEFQTAFHGPSAVDRYLFVAAGASRINLWTRAFEVVDRELRRAHELPERSREIFCLWPSFDHGGFRAIAEQCAALTAREGFTAACIDVIWDNLEFHGGKKNMNVWDYEVCAGYGGAEGLRALIDECRKHRLLVVPWMPAAHLVDRSPVWRIHPDWLLVDTPSRSKGGTGPVYGDIHTRFYDYFRGRTLGVVKGFGLDGMWMDSHLSFAGQTPDRPNSHRLASIYRDFIRAGARYLIVEGDASAFGSYGIGIDESWGRIPDPDLYYQSTMLGWGNDPELYVRHFRRYVAAGAAWVVPWDLLFSTKLNGAAWDGARDEVRRTIRDYARVKSLMIHRHVHDDGSGYTWTNDGDTTKVVWLFADAVLPDGVRGERGKVYVVR